MKDERLNLIDSQLIRSLDPEEYFKKQLLYNLLGLEYQINKAVKLHSSRK